MVPPVYPFRGAPPGDRVVILRFQDMEKANAWYNSPDRKAAGEIGDQYANFRIYAVVGLGQSAVEDDGPPISS